MATDRQKRSVKKILEKRGSVSRIMREEGYSFGTAKNPKNLTDSKGYKELMDEILPDKFLTKKHKELLSVPIITKQIRRGEVISQEESLDVQAISKGLDMAYKIKGHYAPEKKEMSGSLDLGTISEEEKIEAEAYAQWQLQRRTAKANSNDRAPVIVGSEEQDGERKE